ncbi:MULTISPECIES: type II secretion system F family protein [unclassified Nocardioides]|uniref:type II secretion system F family protein n=1 Tax=unclassified Nocardioides TaxID=2615069 RepID=UPI0007030CAF|nr:MULTISPECIES: type II secretion system F family protein [unclassified Nocardioides]KRC57382.1 type II secretion system protein [Nocardioides sp. Root79]KRC74228.1 type II secretion system protein [Nocardioides sp. Root240]
MALLVALAAAGAVVLLLGPPPPAAAPSPPPPVAAPSPDADGVLRRGRWLWAVLAGGGAAAFLGGALALPAGVAVGVVVGVVAGRLEPAAVRRRRDEVRRDLPHVVTLLAAALRSGVAPVEAIDLVCRALPGSAADRLGPIAARLRLGGDPSTIWGALASDPELAPLGRTLARAHRTGAPVVGAVERLGEELARRGRAEVEDRARAIGVRAAVPLGVCLLPSFLVLGIVPLAVALASTITG